MAQEDGSDGRGTVCEQGHPGSSGQRDSGEGLSEGGIHDLGFGDAGQPQQLSS